MDKGYIEAFRAAGGCPSKVKKNYGWYAENSILMTEYDENGIAIPFT